MRLVVTDHSFGNLHFEEEVARQHGQTLEVFDCHTAEETAAALAGASVVFNNLAPIGAAALKALAPGAMLVRYGVGVDNVDLAAAKAAGVTVCNIPDYGAEAVADHAVAMLLALLRRLPLFDTAVRDGSWGAKALVPSLDAFAVTTVGLLGFGRIARAVAQRLSAFGFHLLACDPMVSAAEAAESGVDLVTFEALLARSNALSLHLPLTPSTRNILNAETLASLPQGAVVVNVARGGLIDEAALAQALQSGQLAGAGIDVFEEEPIANDSPLLSAPNTLLSPHAAFYSNASLENLQRLAAEEADRFLKGQPLRCPLDLA